jgi:lambda family phage tail tape measure protein
MATTVENFVLKVRVDGDQKVRNLSGTIQNLSSDLSAFGTSSNAFSNSLGAITSKLGPMGAAATAAGAAFVALGLSALRTADGIQDISDATGISAGALLNFKESVIEAGGGADDFATLATKLNAALQEAAGGNEKLQKSFQALGVFTRDSNGEIRNTQDVLQDIITQFQRGELTGTRYTAAVDLLGKSFLKLNPAALSAANDPFKDAQIAQLAKYQGAIDKLAYTIENKLVTIFGKLAISISESFDRLDRLEAEANQAGNTIGSAAERAGLGGRGGINPFGRGGVPAGQRRMTQREQEAYQARLMAPAVGIPRGRTEAAMAAAAAPAPGKGGDFGATPEATLRAIAASQKRIEQSRAETARATDSEINQDRLRAILTFANQREQIEARTNAQLREIEIQRDSDIARARAEIFDQERLSTAQKQAEFTAKQKELEIKAISDLAKARAQGQELLSREDKRISDIVANSQRLVQNEQARLEVETQRRDLANSLLTATERERANAQDILAIETERLAKLREIQQIIDLPSQDRAAREQEINDIYDNRRRKTLEQQQLDLETSRNFTAGFELALNQYVEDASNAFQRSQEVFSSVTNNMGSALDKFVETGKLDFGDLARNIIADIIKIELRAQAAQYLRMLFGGGGGGGGGILSSLFSALTGSRSAGGPVSAGNAYRVGESGPETFVPTGAGTIVPGIGATSVTYNINAVDASSFRSMIAQDPEFLFAVTEQGRRRQPSQRR